MKSKIKGIVKWVAIITFAFIGIAIYGPDNVMAEGYGLTVAPMTQKLIINPGDSYQASFRMSNPSSSTQDTYYKLEVEPFYTTESGETIYAAEGEYGAIANWTTFDIPTEGKLEPNENKIVNFSINVPENAPAGGQYMSISVTASGKPFDEDDTDGMSGNTTIKEEKRMAHKVYTEITGNTIKQGEISDVNLPSFLLSGNITGSASVKNTGNVHGDATYTLQVFPLFSSEEAYTNEEKPEEVTILPDRTVYHQTSWDKTPSMGIFNVVYTVRFGESMEQISKMVIVCPIWLLFIIFFAVVAIIIWLVMRARSRKSANSRKASAE